MSKIVVYGNELYHFGVKGQKWGERRYQNEDGSYTPQGQSENNGHGRYSSISIKEYRNQQLIKYKNNEKLYNFYKNSSDDELKYDLERKERIKNVLIGTAIIGGLAAGTYIAYRYGVFDKLKQLGISNINKKEDLETSKLIMKETLNDLQNNSAIEIALEQEKDYIYNDHFDDIIIDKQTEIHRIVGEKGIDFSQQKNFIYASYNKNDILAYRHLLVDHFGTGQKVEVVFEAGKDLSVPSQNATMNIFNELFFDKNDSSYRDSLIKTATDFYKSRGYDDDMAKRHVKILLEENPFEEGMYFLVKRGEDSDIFANKLKEKGYDAVIDYFDKGTLGDSPLIVLDPSKSLVKKGEDFVKSLNLDKDIKTLFDNDHISIQDYKKEGQSVDDVVSYYKKYYSEHYKNMT